MKYTPEPLLPEPHSVVLIQQIEFLEPLFFIILIVFTVLLWHTFEEENKDVAFNFFVCWGG